MFNIWIYFIYKYYLCGTDQGNNKMKNIQFVFGTVVTVIFALILLFAFKEYDQCNSIVHQEIDEALKIAIDRDFESRFRCSGVNYSQGAKKRKEEEYNLEGAKIASSGKIIPYSDSLPEETMEKKRRRSLEHILRSKSPVSVTRLDSLFMEELTEKGISGKTNIAFITDGSIVWGKPDKINFFYYSTPFQMQGVDPIDEIQGYVKYNIGLVLSRMGFVIWVKWIVLICMLLGGYVVIQIVREKGILIGKEALSLNQPEPLPLPSHQPSSLSQPLFFLPEHREEESELVWIEIESCCFQCGDVIFDTERRRLYRKKNKKVVKLSEQLVQLFILFVKAEVEKNESKGNEEDKNKAKDKDVKVSDIALTFWPDERDVKKRSIKVSKLVNKLKKELSKIMIVDFDKAGTSYLFKYRLK